MLTTEPSRFNDAPIAAPRTKLQQEGQLSGVCVRWKTKYLVWISTETPVCHNPLVERDRDPSESTMLGTQSSALVYSRGIKYNRLPADYTTVQPLDESDGSAWAVT
jgi:hypothetical protein